jgi:ferrochelatase
VTLDNLLPLIGGELVNHPTITAFHAITDKASRVQRGDLFVCVDQDPKAIDMALENGAYGIVFDKTTPRMDSENAWIKVDSCFDAHLKLLRFHLMPKQIEVYYADIYTLEYIQMLQLGSECKVISADISDVVGRLWDLKETQKLILKEQNEILTLFPMAKKIETKQEATLTAVTPFESNLKVSELFYPRLKIPTVLHDAFLQALYFLMEHQLSFDIYKTNFIKSFTPLSCDKFLSPKEFGKGSINLLFSDDSKLIEDFLVQIEALTPWIKAKLFLKRKGQDFSYNNQTIFRDEADLVETLQIPGYDLGVVCEASSEVLSLAAKPQQLSLF